MSPSRNNEPPERHFRTDRVVMARGRWYVTTRERMDVGPFQTRQEADAVAAQLAKALDGIDDPVVVVALIREFTRRRNQAS